MPFNEETIDRAEQELEKIKRMSASAVVVRLLWFEVQKLPKVGKKNAQALVKEVYNRKLERMFRPKN